MFLLKTLSIAINRYLRLDPEAWQQLPNFAGKTVALEDPITHIKLFFLFTADGVEVKKDFSGEVDTTLVGTPLSLVKFYYQLGKTAELVKSDVKITGDTHLGEQLRDWLNAMEIDWEDPLSRVVGDVAAHEVVTNVKSILAWGKSSLASLKQNITEYLQEEGRYLPTAFELQEFYDDVDVIRNDVERLATRIANIKE